MTDDPLSTADFYPVLPTVEALYGAARDGNAVQARDLLARGACFVDMPDGQGLTSLMIASGRGHAELVEVLLEYGADPCRLSRTIGVSALHLAAHGNHVAVAEILLRHGAPLTLQAPSNGVTPLTSAVWGRSPDMVEFLLRQPGIDVLTPTAFGGRAQGFVAGASVPGDPTASPEDARRIRAAFDAYDAMGHLSPATRELLNAVINGDRAMDEADQLVQIRAQLAAGADVNGVMPVSFGSGNSGHTALLIASKKGHAKVAEALLEAGANMALTDAYMHATPAHKAAYNGHAAVLSVLAARREAFAAIIDARGPFNGYTALHDAVWHGHLDAARVLMKAGADRTVRGHDGLTARDLAARNGYREIVESLDGS